MPKKNAAFPVQYHCYDEFTGALVADDPADHTFRLLRDGVEVTPADAGDTTDIDGINILSLTAGENTGYVNTLVITTTTPGVVIPIVSWTNDYNDLDASIAGILSALAGVDAVTLTSPLVGSLLSLTRGIAYNNNPQPKIAAFVNSAVDITGWTGKLTIRAIDDTGSGSALLTLTTSGGEITLVSGTQYKIEFTCTQANSNALAANLTLASQELQQWIDGFENQVRWNADFDKKFDIVVESGTNRLEGPSGIVLVKEKQTA